MDISYLAVQVVIAIVCASIANMLVPRQIPGKFLGLIVIGLTGVWVGQWGYALLYREYGIQHQLLSWHVEGVEVIPSIIGSAIVLYVVTLLLKWGRYSA